MQIAVDVAGFSAADADELRRAMGAKRSTEKMERLRERFYAGMAANGITGELADEDLREDAGLRQLRVPGEPLDQLRVAGLLQRLVQALLPGGVLRGAAQRPADGLLLAPVAGGRRPPARRAGARPGRQLRAPRARCCNPSHAAPGGRRSGWVWPRCARSATSSRRRSSRSASGRARTATSPISPVACGWASRRPRRWRRRGPSAASAWTGARRSGRPGWWRRCARSSCRAPPWGWSPRSCPG